MNDLKGKSVLVVGLGKSGVAAARFCAERGARVTVADAKKAAELSEATRSLEGLPIWFALGRHDPKLFDNAELIVASPGVPSDLPGIVAAKGRGVPVVGELELAVGAIDRPVVAVTGTNGKTTTTTLIGHLLRGAGLRPCVAGNIGTPLLDVLADAAAADWVVLEVSSFQIETTPSLAPQIGIVLNVTPDHLDRHASFEAYVACKAQLLNQVASSGTGIYNAADEHVSSAVVGAACRLLPFDATGRLRLGAEGQSAAWFGDGDLRVSVRGNDASRYPLANVKLEGAHNRENMLAALAAAELCGAEPAELLPALESFTGLPHRMELVGEFRGVRYYDDSKGTNIGATIRAIEGFAEPIVLIAGGIGKGVDFAPLASLAKGRVKKAVLIGESAGALEAAFMGSAETSRASTMENAVAQAATAAEPGDVVLLSPACASFDMFRDYAHRGESFAAAVRELSQDGR